MAEKSLKSAVTKAANKLHKAINGQRGADFINAVALQLEDAWEEYAEESKDSADYETYELRYEEAVEAHKNFLTEQALE